MTPACSGVSRVMSVLATLLPLMTADTMMRPPFGGLKIYDFTVCRGLSPATETVSGVS